VTAAPNPLISALEALLANIRAATAHALADPASLENDVAAQSQLSAQCDALIRTSTLRLDHDDGARLDTLIAEIRHSLQVYRLVVSAGFRSVTAILEATRSVAESAAGA
jgi:hypothetical protein